MTQTTLQEHMNALKASTSKATQSKEAALQYLKEAGITAKEEEKEKPEKKSSKEKK